MVRIEITFDLFHVYQYVLFVMLACPWDPILAVLCVSVYMYVLFVTLVILARH